MVQVMHVHFMFFTVFKNFEIIIFRREHALDIFRECGDIAFTLQSPGIYPTLWRHFLCQISGKGHVGNPIMLLF